MLSGGHKIISSVPGAETLSYTSVLKESCLQRSDRKHKYCKGNVINNFYKSIIIIYAVEGHNPLNQQTA